MIERTMQVQRNDCCDSKKRCKSMVWRQDRRDRESDSVQEKAMKGSL